MADGVTEELIAAFARAQAAFPTILKGHINPHYKSKYADLSDVLAAVRPVLAAEGIAISQPVRTRESGETFLLTELLGHGGVYTSSIPLYLADLSPQQLGSMLTYYRRYCLASMLGVAADDDDDGNAAQTAPQARQTDNTTTTAVLPLDWRTRPLAQMTFAELRVVAVELGHAFSGGSKSELIRQLEPLVRAASGDEPWPAEGEGEVGGGVTAAATFTNAAPSRPEPEAIPFNPTVANAGSVRAGTNSALKADK